MARKHRSNTGSCEHAKLTCLNQHEYIRKYRCEACRHVMMCSCDEAIGRRHLSHQLSNGTELKTQVRVPVTLGFQTGICDECRGESPVHAPAAAIQCRTIASDEPRLTATSEFHRLQKYLVEFYPLVHRALDRDVVNGLSLLYRWPGSDPSLEPLLLLAHQDVVAAEDESAWILPPFGGTVSENAVWGRGAIDAKGPLIAIFESVERLLGEGYRPRRDIYLAFGHDEEVGGMEGAAAIGELLASRGVKPSESSP